MESSVEMKAIEQQAAIKNELSKSLINNLKKEARRLLTLLAKYNAQRSSDGILSKVPNQIKYQDIEEYCDLISKQFCSKIDELNEKITRIKLDIGKLSNEVKARPDSNVTDRIAKFKEKMNEFEIELNEIWKQQHFLVLNYRMDISVKELQRWTTILNSNKISEEKIKESVNNLFK